MMIKALYLIHLKRLKGKGSQNFLFGEKDFTVHVRKTNALLKFMFNQKRMETENSETEKLNDKSRLKTPL